MDNSTDQLQVRKSGGAWGSVCDDGFDDKTAHAVCNWISKMGGTQLLNGYRTRSNLGGGFVPLFPLFTSGPSD